MAARTERLLRHIRRLAWPPAAAPDRDADILARGGAAAARLKAGVLVVLAACAALAGTGARAHRLQVDHGREPQ